MMKRKPFETKMTVAQVEKVVETIGVLAVKGDLETAHSLEDELYSTVLAIVVAGSIKAQALARAALKSREIEFTRHCG